MDLLPGDILLTRSAGLIGWLIRLGERIRCSGWADTLLWLAKRIAGIHQPDSPADPWWINHAAVSVGDGMLIEALAAGLTLTPASKYNPAQVVVVRLADLIPDITDQERARVVRFARTQHARHDPYSWGAIASIVLQLLTPVRLDVSFDGALICSAFAAQCLEHAGYTVPTRSSLTTMPSDLRHLPTQPPAAPAVTERSAA